MRLSVSQLKKLSALNDSDGLWINTSWTSWPNGKQPKWSLDQFAVAKELVRLALIGAKVEAER